jgi:hypothetical protein
MQRQGLTVPEVVKSIRVNSPLYQRAYDITPVASAASADVAAALTDEADRAAGVMGLREIGRGAKSLKTLSKSTAPKTGL